MCYHMWMAGPWGTLSPGIHRQLAMHDAPVPFPGFIALAFNDQVARRDLDLGLRGYEDLEAMDEEFEGLISVGPGTSSFCARKILGGQVVVEKAVPAELVEQLLGQPIAELIVRSRKAGFEEVSSLDQPVGLKL